MTSPRNKLKVLFFTTRLGGGGAEKHLLRVINYLDRSQFQVALALAKAGGSYEAELAEDVVVYYLGWQAIPSVSVALFASILPLRHLITKLKPDVVCAVMDNANTALMLACRGLSNPPVTVLSVQNPPSIKYRQGAKRLVNNLILPLIPRTYPQSDAVVALSAGVGADLKQLVPAIKPLVIYNAGVDPDVITAAQSTPPETLPSGQKLIVACGRLNPQKGYSYLLDAFKDVSASLKAQLWILGEGELRASLESQIKSLGLTDSVRLLGFKTNPYQYIARADLFVLSSLFEGFGNVIVEAMACGTPVVATDCPYGPAEIITPGVNGLLVPPADSPALSAAILQVLENPELGQQLAQGGEKRASDFQAVAIAAQYGQLFQQLVNRL